MILNRRTLLKTAAVAGAMPALMRTQGAGAAEPFRVGALNPVTGAGSPYGSSMQKAILFAVKEINAAGGAGGQTLEVVAEDDQTSPEPAVLAAKKLVEVNKVRAVLGTWASGVALAVSPIFDAAGIIHTTVAGTSGLAAVNKKGFAFRFAGTSEGIGRSLADGALEEGFKRASIMAFNNASGREMLQGAKSVLQKAGREIVAEVIYEPNQPSYRSEIQAALAKQPEVLIMGSFLPDLTIILREVLQSGADVKFVVPAWAVTPKSIEALGAATDGVLLADYESALGSDAYASFKQRFKTDSGIDISGNHYASCAYDMAMTLALGMEAAGAGADNAAIVKAMHQISGPPGKAVSSFATGKELIKSGQKINYEGASGPLDFDDGGNAKPIYKLMIVKDGKINQHRILKL